MAKAIGIDLGTTNSCMGVLEAGEPTVMPNAEGGRVTPSVVAFSKEGEVIVGEVAKRQSITNPDNTIRSVKRIMGTKEKVKIGGKEYTPQQISAFVLQKLKRDAESYLGEKVEQAVITVPAYFDDAQRTATKEAGKIAGLEVLRIINEPTAASLAYGLDKEKEHTILVFDLGGGTFDVSIMDISEGLFEVKSTSGDTHLGGDDWDERIMNWMADDFKAKNGVDLRKDKMAVQRLNEAAEKAKCELSTAQTTNINLPFVTATAEGPLHLDMTLTRSEMVKMTADLLERCEGPFKQAIKDAKMKPGDIDDVVMVGGLTRMPAVQDLVKKLIGGKEPHKGVNPDEVVATGAALQAGIITKEVKKDILLLDVTPLSLGIETKGGIFTKMIERNTTIPTKKNEIFSTADDGQTSVEVHVLQGERPVAAGNRTLGRFHLVDIPAAPRGIPQIEVTFDIDVDGIVHVHAQDKATGKEQSMTVSGGSSLGKDDIDKMVKEAESHAEEDKKKQEEAEARNEADNLVYSTEKSLREVGDKVDADEKSKIEAVLNDVKEALKGSDIDKIKATAEELKQASYKMAEAVYAQQQAQQQDQSQAQAGGSGEGQAEEEEEVVDADYEVVDEGEGEEKK